MTGFLTLTLTLKQIPASRYIEALPLIHISSVCLIEMLMHSRSTERIDRFCGRGLLSVSQVLMLTMLRQVKPLIWTGV